MAIEMVNSTEDAVLRHVLRQSVAHEWLVCEQLGVHANLMTMHDRLVFDRAQAERPTVAIVMPLPPGGGRGRLGQPRPGSTLSVAPSARYQRGAEAPVPPGLGIVPHVRAGVRARRPKPANILLAGVPEALEADIADFGTTRPGGTQRHVLGTTVYNPPEVCSAYTGHRSPLLHLMLQCFATARIPVCTRTVPPTDPTCLPL
jgi:hypothetical protein